MIMKSYNFIICLFLILAIVCGGIAYFQLLNEFIAIGVALISAISAIITAQIKSNNQAKIEFAETEKRISDSLTNRFNKMQKTMVDTQIETSNRNSKFIVDTVSDINTEIKGIKNEIKEIKDDVSFTKEYIEEINSIKEKREMWRYELNKDWVSSKKRISMLNSNELVKIATVIKETVFVFFDDVLEIDDLSHCDEISVKEKSLQLILDKLDDRIIKCSAQLSSMSEGHDIITKFKIEAVSIIQNYKSNIEKVFVKNTINSVYRNFYNYTSTFHTELLNTLVAVYHEINYN